MQSLTPIATNLCFAHVGGISNEQTNFAAIKRCAELTKSPMKQFLVRSLSSATDLPYFVGNRSQLIIFGGRLEFEITQFVLGAIPHGYHIFLLVDAVGAEEESHAQLCLERLYQFGVVPILTKQLFWELGLHNTLADLG